MHQNMIHDHLHICHSLQPLKCVVNFETLGYLYSVYRIINLSVYIRMCSVYSCTLTSCMCVFTCVLACLMHPYYRAHEYMNEIMYIHAQ